MLRNTRLTRDRRDGASVRRVGRQAKGGGQMKSAAKPSPGPTIHTVVMDERTTDLFSLIDHDVQRRLADFRLGFVAAQEDAIRQAYLRGVRDGFQQGALAAAKVEADRG